MVDPKRRCQQTFVSIIINVSSKYKLNDALIGVDNIEQESEILADIYKEFT